MQVVEHREGRLGEPSRGIESPCMEEKSSLKSIEKTPQRKDNRTRGMEVNITNSNRNRKVSYN